MHSSNRAHINAAAMRIERRRRIKDRLFSALVAFGGWSVMAAIALIFFYLVFEVTPLFSKTKLNAQAEYSETYNGAFLHIDDYNKTGMRLTPRGMEFFQVSDGALIGSEALPIPRGVQITQVVKGNTLTDLVGVGLSNGELIVFKPFYQVAYNSLHQRQVTPMLSYPFGDIPFQIEAKGKPLKHFSLHESENILHVLALSNNELSWSEFAINEYEEVVRLLSTTLPTKGESPRLLAIGQDTRWAYALSGKDVMSVYRLQAGEVPHLHQHFALLEGQHSVTMLRSLLGNQSLLIGDSSGNVGQWSMVGKPLLGKADKERIELEHIRSFVLGTEAITALSPERSRRGFMAGDATGRVGYFYSTTGKTLRIEQIAQSAINNIALSANSHYFLAQSADAVSSWRLDTEHPDFAWHSVWGKVWYEGYDKPEYVWQSSSASPDYESKLSLVPLAFGTFKGAFYAMLMAVPIALGAAIYTAMFMAPSLRRRIKPSIELMQALPTVILGFLAGLWLAPTVENYLPGIVSMMLVTPIVILLCGFLWMQIPPEYRENLNSGWAPLWLIAPVLLGAWLSFYLSSSIEDVLFKGDIRFWLESNTGLSFDQRNALIIGLAMGFAIIPPIYSIAEDALYGVPKHLTHGSLALGATPWQTLVNVVLPTASPGIFSALMIGLGRAIGETMIVLMATGNTPIMDWNIFDGMRTLSANVAVEMGEGEIGSTHFRVLFLSALVLFVLTFVLNTCAEIVRARLRKKYGSL